MSTYSTPKRILRTNIIGLALATTASIYSSTALAETSQNAFTHTANAAISGHNNKHLDDVSVLDCASACVGLGWCVSFDYYKASAQCDLSDDRAADVGGLKTNYADNPFDHYSLHEGALLKFRQTQNAAIRHHNRKQLVDVTRKDCAEACLAPEHSDWCVSFDYYKAAAKCDLSDVVASDVGGLKTDYANDPFDHYSLRKPSLTLFERTANAAILGHNIELLTGVSPAACAEACTDVSRRDWCVSFDYIKESNACDLSSKRAEDVGGLKTNYAGNPYDHYSLEVSEDQG